MYALILRPTNVSCMFCGCFTTKENASAYIKRLADVGIGCSGSYLLFNSEPDRGVVFDENNPEHNMLHDATSCIQQNEINALSESDTKIQAWLLQQEHVQFSTFAYKLLQTKYMTSDEVYALQSLIDDSLRCIEHATIADFRKNFIAMKRRVLHTVHIAFPHFPQKQMQFLRSVFTTVGIDISDAIETKMLLSYTPTNEKCHTSYIT